MKILIVEDEDDLLETYKIVLEEKNHQVTVSQDGETCLQIYRDELEKLDSDPQLLPFDVIVIDYKIPKKDGLQVAKEILTLRPNQRIIFTSAYVKEIIEKAVQSLSGRQELIENLQKPFELSEFIDKIELKELIHTLNKFGFGVSDSGKISRNYIECKDLINRLVALEKNYVYN